jgi:hypothetical protein
MVEIIKKLAIKYHIILSDEEKQLEHEWLEYVNELQNKMKQNRYEFKIHNTKP